MSADTLLSRLDGVRPTGAGRWVARCPAHADRSPSLSIRELDDRTLLHCFAGCEAQDVLAAVGLEWSCLYPMRSASEHRTRGAPRIPYADALRCIAAECWIVLLAGGRLERRERLCEEELARLTIAVQRIAEAARVAGVHR